MTGIRRRLASLRDEGGYSLIELLTAMAILSVVMGSLTVVMVSATKADARMNNEFQAQTAARTALERFRREGHAACRAEPVGPSASVTLVYVTSGSCPASGGTRVTWCTVATGTGRYGLFRAPGSACDATATKIADHLRVATAFNYQTTTQRRAKVGITLAVNPSPSAGKNYSLEDDIVLRNSPRVPA